jgi:hypothetical protein
MLLSASLTSETQNELIFTQMIAYSRIWYNRMSRVPLIFIWRDMQYYFIQEILVSDWILPQRMLRTAVFNAEVPLFYKGGGCQLISIYQRTPRVFAVEIRKYHQKIPLERYYVIEQFKIALNYKLAILEQCELTIPIYNILEQCKQ